MHPCCNKSLQTGTKIIAITQLVFFIFIFLTVFFGEALTGGAYNNETNDDDELSQTSPMEDYLTSTVTDPGPIVTIFSIVLIVVGVMYIFVPVLLFLGAIKRNRTLCMAWFVINVIFMILVVLEVLRDIISRYNKHNDISTVLWMFLQSYFLWVVWAFMSDLKVKEEAPLSPYSNPMPAV